jgi:hypothetical protein
MVVFAVPESAVPFTADETGGTLLKSVADEAF